jgi:hypothetical protein
VLGVEVVARADHRQNGPVAVAEDDERRLPHVLADRRKVLLDGHLDALLERRVERGRHRGSLALLGAELAAHVVDEVRGAEVGMLAQERERRSLGKRALVFGDEAVVLHELEDVRPALFGRGELLVRVVHARPARQNGEKCRLPERQRRRGLAEVEPRRRFGSPRAVAVVDAVQVLLEDLGLRRGSFEAAREHRFAELVAERAPSRMVGRLDDAHELHRERGSSVRHAKPLQVEPRRPQDSDRIDAAMVEEPAVFGGERGMHQVR